MVGVQDRPGCLLLQPFYTLTQLFQTVIVRFYISSSSGNGMSNNLVVKGIYKECPFIKFPITADTSHVGDNDFKRSLGIPASLDEVWKYLAFLAWFLILISLGQRANAGSLTAFMYQIVRTGPFSLLPDGTCDGVVAPSAVFLMPFHKHLRQNSTRLDVTILGSLSPPPFVITGTVGTHDLAEQIDWVSHSQIFDDLKLFPLPVTNSFRKPLPFTWYPFFNRATSASNFAIRS